MKINEIEKSYQNLSEEQLKAKTPEFKERLAKGETIEDILPEAFAAVKNTCRRLCGSTMNICGQELKWDMIPYDVQLMGGVVLHKGTIAEMATGEGKTLVATLPLYLNALIGKNCQLVTVNDYLAKRDSEWMGSIYKYLGLTVGCLQNQMMPSERREQYACDITYGTNSEFGFDYLRDMGMAMNKEQIVQRNHYYAIIDEVDSILIDEARTPLIISGPVAVSTHQFDVMKPGVDELFKKQNFLCSRLIAEAREELKKTVEGSAEEEASLIKLVQVKFGMVSYWTAYLKANYPAEYMAALLTSVKDDRDKLALYLNECRHMGIKVLPPDVNESRAEFASVGTDIRFGLTAIKNVGVNVVDSIIETRQTDGKS